MAMVLWMVWGGGEQILPVKPYLAKASWLSKVSYESDNLEGKDSNRYECYLYILFKIPNRAKEK